MEDIIITYQPLFVGAFVLKIQDMKMMEVKIGEIQSDVL